MKKSILALGALLAGGVSVSAVAAETVVYQHNKVYLECISPASCEGNTSGIHKMTVTLDKQGLPNEWRLDVEWNQNVPAGDVLGPYKAKTYGASCGATKTEAKWHFSRDYQWGVAIATDCNGTEYTYLIREFDF